MATVSELKERARQYEQERQPDKALQIYRHILKHFEGTPAEVKVLPLYVKVGDLLLKSSRRADAVMSYEKAAEAYAENGAAQRVAALCAKIERVDPTRTDCYARFTRHLVEHDHVGSARDVLASYAEAHQLTEMLEALDDLAGRATVEIRPLIERLLQAWEAGDSTPGEVARRVSTQLQQATDHEVADLTPEPDETDLASPEPSEPATLGTVAPVEYMPQERPAPAPMPTPAPVSAPTPTPDPLAVPPDGTAPRVAVGLEERAWDRAAPAPAPARPSPARLAGLGFAAGLAVGLAISVVFSGGRNEPAIPAAPEASSPSPAPPPPTPLAGTAPDTPTAGSATDTTAVSTPADSLPADPRPMAPPPPAEPVAADGTRVPPEAVFVPGLAVQSVAESELRGVAGYRVVHNLGRLGELTIESYPDTSPSNVIGRIRINVTEPDTVLGMVRLPEHMVYASAIMPEDSLRALMQALVESRNQGGG